MSLLKGKGGQSIPEETIKWIIVIAIIVVSIVVIKNIISNVAG